MLAYLAPLYICDINIQSNEMKKEKKKSFYDKNQQ